ncbi:MAG: hypothetical protein AAF938_07530 [Myxococcota bacterium]
MLARTISNALLPLLGCILALGGCASDTVDTEEPVFDGAADGFGNVEDLGSIRFGGEVTGTFDEDFQFFSVSFAARANAQIRLDVTQSGSSRDLDTVLYVYRDGEAPSRIAVDDDSGWGQLSRIEDFRLFTEGNYLAVIGTERNRGRGNFRLTLECEGDECRPDSPVISGCPAEIEIAMLECIDEVGFENGLELPVHAAVVETCGTRDALEQAFENECFGDDAPTFCSDGANVLDNCRLFATRGYPTSVDVAEIIDGDRNEQYEDMISSFYESIEDCNAFEEAGCLFSGDVYRFDPVADLSMNELFAYTRTETEVGPGAYPQQRVGPSVGQSYLQGLERDGIRDQFEATLADLELDLGDAEFGTMETYAPYSFNFGECEGSVFIAYWRDLGTFVTYESAFCQG